MTHVLKKLCLILMLTLAPASAMAITTEPPQTTLQFVTGTAPDGTTFIGPNDTFNLSDGFAVVLGLGGRRTGEGQFAITVSNDLDNAGTFSLTPFGFPITIGFTPTFSFGNTVIETTGPFSSILQPGESLILTVIHDGARFGGSLGFGVSGSTSIPLPASVWMLVAALGFGGLIRRRRRTSAALPAAA